MATPSNIVKKILEILRTSAYLSYVKDENIFLGVRENIVNFPCIIIEPVSNKIIDENLVNEKKILTLNIVGYLQVYDKEKQIAGDGEHKGILDLENDILKALCADTTLGLTGVYDLRIPSSLHNFEQYPIRGVALDIEVEYNQNRKTRE